MNEANSETDYPGVYIEETGFRSKPIEGVTTTTNPWRYRGAIAAAGVAVIALMHRARRRRKPRY
jgi:hypothetical protein